MEFPISKFTTRFSEFGQYTESQIIEFADWATCFFGANNCNCDEKMWMLITAHFLQLDINKRNGNGGQSGAVTSATIDKVSISFQVPTSSDSWSHWLNLTPYGRELMALIKICNPIGQYVGGLPERSAFKNVGGIYIRGFRR